MLAGMIEASSGHPISMGLSGGAGMARRTEQPLRVSPRGWQAANAAGRHKKPSAQYPAEQPGDPQLPPKAEEALQPAVQESMLLHVVPLLALIAVSFAAGLLVGYQLGSAQQIVTGSATPSTSRKSETAEEAVEQEAVEERRTVMKELRSSGAAAAAALQAEAALHSSRSRQEPSSMSPLPEEDGPSILGDVNMTEQKGGCHSAASSPGHTDQHERGMESEEAHTWTASTAQSRQSQDEGLQEDLLLPEAGTPSNRSMLLPKDAPSSSESSLLGRAATPITHSAESVSTAAGQMQRSSSTMLEQVHAVIGGSWTARGGGSVQLELRDELAACLADVVHRLKVSAPSSHKYASLQVYMQGKGLDYTCIPLKIESIKTILCAALRSLRKTMCCLCLICCGGVCAD